MREPDREKWEVKGEGTRREAAKGAEKNQGERVDCTNREIGTAGFASFRYSLFESDTKSISHELRCEFRFSIIHASLHLCQRLHLFLDFPKNIHPIQNVTICILTILVFYNYQFCLPLYYLYFLECSFCFIIKSSFHKEWIKIFFH